MGWGSITFGNLTLPESPRLLPLREAQNHLFSDCLAFPSASRDPGLFRTREQKVRWEVLGRPFLVDSSTTLLTMDFSSTPSSPVLNQSTGHLGDDDATQDPLGGLGQVFSNSDRAPLVNANSLARAAVNLTVASPPKRGRPVGARNKPANAAKLKKARRPSIPWCPRQDKAVVVAFFETSGSTSFETLRVQLGEIMQ